MAVSFSFLNNVPFSLSLSLSPSMLMPTTPSLPLYLLSCRGARVVSRLGYGDSGCRERARAGNSSRGRFRFFGHTCRCGGAGPRGSSVPEALPGSSHCHPTHVGLCAGPLPESRTVASRMEGPTELYSKGRVRVEVSRVFFHVSSRELGTA